MSKEPPLGTAQIKRSIKQKLQMKVGKSPIQKANLYPIEKSVTTSAQQISDATQNPQISQYDTSQENQLSESRTGDRCGYVTGFCQVHPPEGPVCRCWTWNWIQILGMVSIKKQETMDVIYILCWYMNEVISEMKVGFGAKWMASAKNGDSTSTG